MSQDSKTIAICMTGDGYYARAVLLGVMQGIRERPRWQAVFMGYGWERVITGRAKGRRAQELRQSDGAMVYIDNSARLRAVGRLAIPVVNVDDTLEAAGVPTVGCDNVQAGAMAARHFLERGFRHFGFVANTSHYSRLRCEGFVGELQKAGFTCDISRHWRWEIDDVRTRQWLLKRDRPLAVMACNDLYGMQVATLCDQLGLRIPEDIAVIGVDNDEAFCSLCPQPLSSVAVPAQRIGYEGTRMLEQLMAGRPVAPRVLLPPPSLLVRHSTDTVGISDPVLQQAIRFIRDHASEPIQASDVVVAASACRTVLDRKFRAALGHTADEEIWRTRVEKAKHALTHTDMKVETVARHAGFSSYQVFHTIFRRRTGQSPMQFRLATR